VFPAIALVLGSAKDKNFAAKEVGFHPSKSSSSLQEAVF
jgi:hypothetical protein